MELSALSCDRDPNELNWGLSTARSTARNWAL